VYAATFGSGVFKTTDGGIHWVPKSGPNSLSLLVVLDPSNPSNVYVGTNFGAFKSADGGDTWTGMISGLIDPTRPITWVIPALAVEPSDPHTLYAGSREGFFKSLDRGSSWIDIGGVGNREVSTLLVDPSSLGTIYAGGLGSVYKSTNFGATWMRGPAAEIANASSIAVDPRDASIVYAASQANGARKSTDGGIFWNYMPMRAGDAEFGSSAVAINPFDSNIVYFGTNGGGVFRSTDRGNTWNQLNDGLTNLTVKALAIDPMNTNIVYAGTSGGGVFSIQLLPVVSGVLFSGKNVTVVGENFSKGAIILMNGTPQKTLEDPASSSVLTGKKLAKRIAAGQTVTLQVQNPDGSISNDFRLTRPT